MRLYEGSLSLSLSLSLSYLDLKPITIPFPSNKEKVAPIWQVWGKKNTNESVSQQNLSERERKKNVEQLERFHFLCLHLFSFFFQFFGSRPKNVPVADVWTEGVCMLFIYTLPYGTQYDHHNNQ